MGANGGMNIGAAIKQLRLARKLTQEELAELAHTSKPNISNLERNAQGFSPVILTSLGRALGVKVSELFRLAEEIGGEPVSEPSGSDVEELQAILETMPPARRAALLRFVKDWTAADQ